MQCTPIYLTPAESHKLLTARNTDAIALYLYLRNGNQPVTAKRELGFTDERYENARNTLIALELLLPSPALSQERKNIYSEQDVLQNYQANIDFKSLVNEVQYRLGKTLNTEELKILLNITNYLGMPPEIVCILVNHCVSLNASSGSFKKTTIYQVEKEAYRWVDMGIENREQAYSYVQTTKDRNTRLRKIMEILQIRGRNLTPPEQRYTDAWLQLGLSDELIALAYEKTCVSTGGMNWRYMDAILQRWKNEGYSSPADVKSGGRHGRQTVGPRQLDEGELEAIQRMLQSDPDDFLNGASQVNGSHCNYL